MSQEDKRYAAAEEVWGEYDCGDVTVVESNQFETDGPDRLICKFYYAPDEADPYIDSESASFCVNFVAGTDKVADAYINW